MFFSDLALTWELLQLTSSALSMSSTSALRGEQSTYRSVAIRRVGGGLTLHDGDGGGGGGAAEGR